MNGRILLQNIFRRYIIIRDRVLMTYIYFWNVVDRGLPTLAEWHFFTVNRPKTFITHHYLINQIFLQYTVSYSFIVFKCYKLYLFVLLY